MANETLTALRKLLKKRFKGVLTKGKHVENGQCCALEALSVLRGVPWTDNPENVRSFDLRPLNDIAVSDEIRTKHLLPVLAAYDGSLDWPKERQQTVATALAIGVVNVLIAELAVMPDEIRAACRKAKTANAASAASHAASAASYAASRAARYAASAASHAASAASDAASYAASAASDAASAANYAASAASYAASAASYAASERVFIAACKVWLDAANS